MIHFYRFSGAGFAIGYNINVDDKTLTRAKNNYKESVKVEATGPVKLKAATESVEVLELDLKPGRHYYVRCSVTTGFAVGHPKLEKVDSVTGKAEYDSIKK